uniref:Uncharacterized protein n=1 Tax=Opuntia streptacantha TaxID=393608 RepID=A0A7C8ZZ13_OPUST
MVMTSMAGSPCFSPNNQTKKMMGIFWHLFMTRRTGNRSYRSWMLQIWNWLQQLSSHRGFHMDSMGLLLVPRIYRGKHINPGVNMISIQPFLWFLFSFLFWGLGRSTRGIFADMSPETPQQESKIPFYEGSICSIFFFFFFLGYFFII